MIDEENLNIDLDKETELNAIKPGFKNDFSIEIPIEIWCIIIGFCGWREKVALKSCCRAFDLEIHRNNIIDTFVKEYANDCARQVEAKNRKGKNKKSVMEIEEFKNKQGRCYVKCGDKTICMAVHDTGYLLKYYSFVIYYGNRIEYSDNDYNNIWFFDRGLIGLVELTKWRKLLKIVVKKDGVYNNIIEEHLVSYSNLSYVGNLIYCTDKFEKEYMNNNKENPLSNIQQEQIFGLLTSRVKQRLSILQDSQVRRFF